jgi:hypothetical protein
MNMTCQEYLLLVYRGYAARTGVRVAFLERTMSCPSEIAHLSDDERRNEPAIYSALFSDECQLFLEEVYENSIGMMRGRPFGDCEDALRGLAFLQEVFATALWRHRQPVAHVLASFAREFDRLDSPAERERLYALAQRP